MDNPNETVLKQVKALVKTSITEMRPLLIVTGDVHTKHYGFATEDGVSKDLFTFTNLDGQRLLVPWKEIDYPGLCPPIDVATGRAKAATAK